MTDRAASEKSPNIDAANITPDTEMRGVMGMLPAGLRPYAALARFDRPIGWWLLYWPCVWGLALAGGLPEHWPLLLWFQINMTAKLVALGSLALVAAYPFMKRITWWPQAWLGLVFSWGALVGWAAIEARVPVAGLLLYAGAIFWVIGYDTIYALQDREDDALVGIKSSALRMGRHVRGGVALLYAIALALWCAAIWQVRPQPAALLALLPMALHLLWQVATLKPDNGDDALAKFRSNRFAGLLAAAGFFVVGASG